MLTFNEFTNDNLILEMPHIMLNGGNEIVDLELEVHANMAKKDFIQYIDDWVSGKPIQSKTPGFTMKVNANSVKEFIKKVLTQPYLKNFTLLHYDEATWETIQQHLKEKL